MIWNNNTYPMNHAYLFSELLNIYSYLKMYMYVCVDQFYDSDLRPTFFFQLKKSAEQRFNVCLQEVLYEQRLFSFLDRIN